MNAAAFLVNCPKFRAIFSISFLLFENYMTPSQPPSFDSQKAASQIRNIINEVEKVTKGKRHELELLVTCLLANGHVLIEDNPGSGKTVTARALAAVISGGTDAESKADFHRIQFTPDLLPMDLIGSHIFDDRNKTFIFRKGPLFTNILLADEINRASPKVQSALLESMAEGQITIGDQTHILDKLFFVIATQNPIEMEGTYPLPAAQLDRFAMKISFGYVDEDTEFEILKNYLQIDNNLSNLKQCISRQELIALQQQVHQVQLHEELIRSVLHIIHSTRTDANIHVGASTRSGISFLRCLRAYALVQGRDYVIEDDIQILALPVLHHRITFKNALGRKESLERIVRNELSRLATLKL